MKNFILGLAVVAFAFSASAFTNTKALVNDHFGQNTSGDYDLVVGTFNETKCLQQTNVCAYKVLKPTELPNYPNPTTTISADDIQTLIDNEVIEPVRDSSGDILLGAYQF